MSKVSERAELCTGRYSRDVEFEKRVETYFHLTSWDPKQLAIDRPYSTSWDRSAYWQAQEDDGRQLAIMLEEFKTLESARALPALGITPEQWARSKARNQRAKEQVFERVRVDEFPNAPSRMRCMFVCESEDQLREYIRKYRFPLAGRTIIELQMGTLDDQTDTDLSAMKLSRPDFERLNDLRRVRVHPKHLDCNANDHDRAAAARFYWSGADTESTQLTEVLFEGFFAIKRVVESWPPITSSTDAGL
jgi:hypothetical protein